MGEHSRAACGDRHAGCALPTALHPLSRRAAKHGMTGPLTRSQFIGPLLKRSHSLAEKAVMAVACDARRAGHLELRDTLHQELSRDKVALTRLGSPRCC